MPLLAGAVPGGGAERTPASRFAAPTARVLAFAELEAALSADTAGVTQEQRRATLTERLREVTRLQRC